MCQIYPTIWEVMKISDLQQQLFDPGQFDRRDYINIDEIAGDWNRDVCGDVLPLNKLIKGTPSHPDPPPSKFGGLRILEMPPKSQIGTMPPKLGFGGHDLGSGTSIDTMPPKLGFGGHDRIGRASMEPMPPKLEFGGHDHSDRLEIIEGHPTERSRSSHQAGIEMPPKLEFGGHDPTGRTLDNRSRVNVKGIVYLLTHSKSNKYMPPHKGWLEIKPRGKNQFLYLRWWDEKIKRSRCLGRVDKLE
jgi:hypothetical protein